MLLYRVMLNDCTPHKCGLPLLRISFLPLRGFLLLYSSTGDDFSAAISDDNS
jgi:hypothetical protein